MKEVNGIKIPESTEELSEYELGWAKMMVDIWQEQMRQLGCIDSGQLYASITERLNPGDEAYIQHSFPMYGIYVANGVGREFGDDWRSNKFNGGSADETGLGNGWLWSQDESYRKEHGLDKPRKRGPKWGGGYTSGQPRKAAPWFDKKYWYSRMRLNAVLEQYYGERGTYLLVESLNNMFQTMGGKADINRNAMT